MSAPPRPGAPPRPDASMTLLREVTERPLDPGYAAAAARRAAARAEGSPSASRRARLRAAAVTALLAAVAGLVVVAAVAQLRQPAAAAADRADLVREITSRTAVADREARTAARLRAQVQAEQDAVLAGDPDAPSAGDGLLVASGTTPVRGPGLVVTLDDARSADAEPGADPRDVDTAAEGRVQDVDLQQVANGLWAAGAEAIAIDDQRLTSATAIRGAGGAVLVNFRPLSPPYRVEAIGAPNALQADFALTAAAQYLQQLRTQYGIGVSVASRERLELPALDAQRLYSASVLAGGGGASTAPAAPTAPTSQEAPP